MVFLHDTTGSLRRELHSRPPPLCIHTKGVHQLLCYGGTDYWFSVYFLKLAKRVIEQMDASPIKLIKGLYSLNTMKQLWVLAACLLLVACAGFKQGSYSFEEGFNYLSDLDFRHGGNFKKERMDMNFVDLKKIEAFQKDLTLFKARVSQDPDSIDKKKLLWFIEARDQMLGSERFYQLGSGMGNFSKMESVSCDKQKEMEFAFKYFLAARQVGVNATTLLDRVLQDFDVAQRLVGVHESGSDVDERPRFYLSHWDAVASMLEDLSYSLNTCLSQAE